MPGAQGLTAALETAGGVEDTGVRRNCHVPVEVWERYSPDEQGD